MSRRAENLDVARPQSSSGPVHLLVDSTGLKLCGSGEWLLKKHGMKTRRSWRKLHIAVDADTGQIVPPRSSAVPSETSRTAPTMRDRHLQIIAERGRLAWQKASGYNLRALVEADISRFKRVIGDGLRSRTDRRRATEVAIAVSALNRMLELGRPEYVRIP